MFFRGRGWSESEAEAKEVNQVYEAEESPQFAGGGDKGNQVEGDDCGWT